MVSVLKHSERFHQRIDMGICCDRCEGLGDVWVQTSVDDGFYDKCERCHGEGIDIDKVNAVLSEAAYADMTGGAS